MSYPPCQTGGMNRTKTVRNLERGQLPAAGCKNRIIRGIGRAMPGLRAVGREEFQSPLSVHRIRMFECLGNTPSGATIRAAVAFPKDKWNLQLTKNGASLMML
jgi:hypothetical protein